MSADAGKGHHTAFLAGGWGGFYAAVVAMGSGDGFAAVDAGAAVLGIVKGPVAAHMVGKLGNGFFVAMSADAGKGHHTAFLAGRSQCLGAFVITVVTGNGLSAVDTGAGMLIFCRRPAFADMVGKLRNGYFVTVTADAGKGHHAAFLAGGRCGFYAVVIGMNICDGFAA